MKFLNSEKFYSLVSILGNFIVNSSEELVKQWLGTVVGQRFLKWFTDIIVSKFWDSFVEPLMRVGAVRAGYEYDKNNAEERFKKLKKVEGTTDEELYLRTLNDTFNRVPIIRKKADL